MGDLPDTGFDVLNWSHKLDVLEAIDKTGGRLCLMGNVPPLEVGVQGTAEMMNEHARAILTKTRGAGIILSVGGGVSPGMPKENILALGDVLAAAG